MIHNNPSGTIVLYDCHNLRSSLRKLWLDHVLWTRIVIIDTAASLPDAEVATARLLQNQTDIGNAVRSFHAYPVSSQSLSV
jgi:hypothetical protein